MDREVALEREIARLKERIAVLETQLEERTAQLRTALDDIRRATSDGDETVFDLVREQNSRLGKVEDKVERHLREHDLHESVQEGKQQAYRVVYEVGRHWWKVAIGVVAGLEALSKAGYL